MGRCVFSAAGRVIEKWPRRRREGKSETAVGGLKKRRVKGRKGRDRGEGRVIFVREFRIIHWIFRFSCNQAYCNLRLIPIK